MPSTLFITGSSTGFGHAVAQSALKAGYNVVATLRKPSDLNDFVASLPAELFDRLLVVKCDVTIPSDITSAFDLGIAKFGRIDVVFNNAGYGFTGEIESVPEEAGRKMFDVNFWGAANVSKEAIRVFREVNKDGNGKKRGGWLLVNSSLGGLQGVPGFGHYCASKHALEGLTESLFKELDPDWNIKITVIEAGAFRTPGAIAVNAPENAYPAIAAYSNTNLPSHSFRNFLSDVNNIKGDVVKAADRIIEVVTALKDKSKDDSEARIPLHWVIEKDAVQGAREHLKSVLEEVDRYERWSDNLLLTDKAITVFGK